MFKYLGSIFLLLVSFTSFAAEFVVGQDYDVIKNSESTGSTTKAINVTEFFSFGCPWCYKLEPAVNSWVAKQGTKINFNKVPVIFNKDWDYYARAYYTAQALSLNDKLNPALFKEILDNKQALNTKDTMIAFLCKNGVDSAAAQSAFNHSPSIDLDVATSQRLMGNYHISAVPAFVVNNQFKTDLQMAKTEKRLFEILEFLLAQDNKKQA
jgi:thiol:disulfide interchange protein DsbA